MECNSSEKWITGSTVQKLIEKLAEQFGCEEVLTPMTCGLPTNKEIYSSGLGSLL